MVKMGLLLLAASGLGLAPDGPVWVEGGAPTARAREVIKLLEQAETKGLDPADYDGPLWASRLAALDKRDESGWIRFDSVLGDAVTRYVSDLRNGRANPGVYLSAGRDSETQVAELVRRHIVDAADLGAGLREIEPSFPSYWRTLRALEKYRILANDDDGEALPAVEKPVEPGESYPGIPRLVRLLRALGDLPDEAAPPDGSPSYAAPIVTAVKRFQARHGLEVDGLIGRATIAQLNIPLRDRVRQLELALERWRWLPHEFSRPPVMVNLPEFRLRALDIALRPVLDTKIIAGKARDTQTPLLAGGLSSVIFRPYWNVPYSILRAELLPEIARNPAYLAANNYEVTTSRGQVVTSSEVTADTLTRLRSGEFLLRQVPGPKNALGLVKFVFPNNASVYLHDTPGKSLFAKARRDFSHACIRVENAPEFAVWVLEGEEGWNRERIQAAMNGSKTLEVNLKRPIPLMIAYIRAVVLESGEVRFFEDLYGYDADLEKQLSGRAGKPAITSGARGPHPRE